MTVTTMFDLAREIAELHESSESGRITVIPVIVDDLAGVRPLLRGLAEVLRGQLFDCADPVSPAQYEDLLGTQDAVSRAAIERALVTPEGRSVVLRDQGGGKLVPEFVGVPTGTEPSAGDRTLLAAAWALSRRDLFLQSFAIVTYDSTIDLPFRRALWSLLADHFSGMPSDVLRTLVVVVEGDIDIDLHCDTGRGFRFALQDGRLLRRKGRDDLAANVRVFSQLREPFVIFLGAGFSASTKLPLGDRARDFAVRRLLGLPENDLFTSADLARRFYRWLWDRRRWLTETERRMGEDIFAQRLTLERVVRAERNLHPALPTLQMFRTHHDQVIGDPGVAAQSLARVVERFAGHVILVEVNFDTLVETCSLVDLRVFASPEEFEHAATYLASYMDGNETRVPLLKLHGTIEDLPTCIVSEEQTERGVGAGKLDALRALISRDRQLRWIYIGVSMRDRDLLPVLSSEEFGRKLNETWVSPYPVQSLVEFGIAREPHWRNSEWRSLDERLITETADSFFAAFEAVLFARG